MIGARNACEVNQRRCTRSALFSAGERPPPLRNGGDQGGREPHGSSSGSLWTTESATVQGAESGRPRYILKSISWRWGRGKTYWKVILFIWHLSSNARGCFTLAGYEE